MFTTHDQTSCKFQTDCQTAWQEALLPLLRGIFVRWCGQLCVWVYEHTRMLQSFQSCFVILSPADKRIERVSVGLFWCRHQFVEHSGKYQRKHFRKQRGWHWKSVTSCSAQFLDIAIDFRYTHTSALKITFCTGQTRLPDCAEHKGTDSKHPLSQRFCEAATHPLWCCDWQEAWCSLVQH